MARSRPLALICLEITRISPINKPKPQTSQCYLYHIDYDGFKEKIFIVGIYQFREGGFFA